MRTFGQLTHHPHPQDPSWRVKSTPDIIMRVHRVFPRMLRPDSQHLVAKDTKEFCADLEWMLQRYPMDCPDLARLSGAAADYRASQQRLFDLISAPPAPSDFAMALPPRAYQAQATAIYLEQAFLLCGDVVGLGKTVVGIASLTDKRTLPALVVVKPHLAIQWREEIGKFIPTASVHIINRSQPYALPVADVYVISYNKLAGWWGDLCRFVRSVVFDEMQELRRMDSKKYQAAKSICENVPFRLGLSATPIHNYGGEIWALYNLLAPDALGSQSEFKREWCHYGDQVKDPDALGHYLRNQHLFIRRTRSEVGRELPPITRYVQEVPYDAEAYEKGVSTAAELARIILSGTFVERGQAARTFDLKLRQATAIAKAPAVADLVRMLVESGESVLLAGWHRAVYDVWAEALRDLNPSFFTGEETAKGKEDSRQAFIAGVSKVLIMSLRSGAGINGLQAVCSTVVFGEMDWTPAVHEQFIGRLARDGQGKPIQVYFPVIEVGSDPVMANVLGLKRAQSSGIVDLGEDIDAGRDFIETDPQRVKQLAEDFLASRPVKHVQTTLVA
jgi:superfamily II DNA or RNA helicase